MTRRRHGRDIWSYIKSLLELLRRIYEVPAYFKPSNMLRQHLMRLKDQEFKERVIGPLCRIACEDGEASYIGEAESL